MLDVNWDALMAFPSASSTCVPSGMVILADSTMPEEEWTFSVAPAETPSFNAELFVNTAVPAAGLEYSIAPMSTMVAVSLVMVTVCATGAKPGICADTLKVTGLEGEGSALPTSDSGKKPCEAWKLLVAPPSICTKAESLTLIRTLKLPG